jgi:hypothetical protein
MPVFKCVEIVGHRGRRRTQRNHFVLQRPLWAAVAIHPHENRRMIDELAALLINESFDKE